MIYFMRLSYGVGSGKIRTNKSDYDREVYLDLLKKMNILKLKQIFLVIKYSTCLGS